ncbi:RTA1-domain-containing protein [Hypoxylon trugodes]|uniref:RTA1-domain-containing protein n=1 Tax=Hypoxylon trugodes TaxID=326681 RepID=UPI002190495F|nr:RTA1-domain-containing protein [Hypoxylon trugodes]KAI1392995.1 RTA1-domain-containing protein [Hypoxylon trugodes]
MADTLPAAIQDPNNCQKSPLPGIGYSYGYQPSLAAGITFCALFGIAFFGHLLQLIRLRRWTSALLAIGALTELIGWSGRTWSAECPYNRNAFFMQITTLIIGPVFFTGALYMLLGAFINSLGRQYSLMSPRMYNIIFMTCDLISLVVQAVGGALAASANTDDDMKLGTNIMVAGVFFQLAAMIVFTLLTMDFLRKSSKFGIPQEYNKIIMALVISLLAIFARNIFRTVELLEGWRGYLITHEVYFIALDGALMVLAVGIFLPFDPARTIPKAYQVAKEPGELSEFSAGV